MVDNLSNSWYSYILIPLGYSLGYSLGKLITNRERCTSKILYKDIHVSYCNIEVERGSRISFFLKDNSIIQIYFLAETIIKCNLTEFKKENFIIKSMIEIKLIIKDKGLITKYIFYKIIIDSTNIIEIGFIGDKYLMTKVKLIK